jgi:hypothetical protein
MPGGLSRSGGGAISIALGNLGAGKTLALGGRKDVVATATLTANGTITVTGLSAPCRFDLVITQDATGARTLTVSDGVANLVVPVNTDPNALSFIKCRSIDGVGILVVT